MSSCCSEVERLLIHLHPLSPRQHESAQLVANPSRFSPVNSYGLDMRLIDPSHVNLCGEAFTLSTEN